MRGRQRWMGVESVGERDREGERGVAFGFSSRKRECFVSVSLASPVFFFSIAFSLAPRSPCSLLLPSFPLSCSVFSDFKYLQAQSLPCRHPANGLRGERATPEAGTAGPQKMSGRGGDDDERGGEESFAAAAAAAPPAAPTDRDDDDQASTSGAFITHKVETGG